MIDKQQKEIINRFILTSFELGKEILDRGNQTITEQKFLNQLDNILELIEKGDITE